jgi:hypothetical protein
MTRCSPFMQVGTAVLPYFRNEQVLLCPSDTSADKHYDGELTVNYCMNEHLGSMILRNIAAPAEVSFMFACLQYQTLRRQTILQPKRRDTSSRSQ